MVNDQRSKAVGAQLLQRLLEANKDLNSVEQVEFLLDRLPVNAPAWRSMGIQINVGAFELGYKPVEKSGWFRPELAD